MKVLAITQQQYKPRFKQKDDSLVLGYDDEVSQTRRNYIRKWQEEHYMPYQSIYKDGRKSNYEMNRMFSGLVRKPEVIDNELINQLCISGLSEIGNNSYRGAMIPTFKVGNLYNSGIRGIIAIDTAGSDALKKKCEKYGMNYQNIKFDYTSDEFQTMGETKTAALHEAKHLLKLNKEAASYVNYWLERWKEGSRRGIDEFTKYIQSMQEGNVFIGCFSGTWNTDDAITFDYLFNPKMRHGSKLNTNNFAILPDLAESLYHNLTDSDKLKMGWTKEFEQTFLKRLGKLRKNSIGMVKVIKAQA